MKKFWDKSSENLSGLVNWDDLNVDCAGKMNEEDVLRFQSDLDHQRALNVISDSSRLFEDDTNLNIVEDDDAPAGPAPMLPVVIDQAFTEIEEGRYVPSTRSDTERKNYLLAEMYYQRSRGKVVGAMRKTHLSMFKVGLVRGDIDQNADRASSGLVITESVLTILQKPIKDANEMAEIFARLQFTGVSPEFAFKRWSRKGEDGCASRWWPQGFLHAAIKELPPQHYQPGTTRIALIGMSAMDLIEKQIVSIQNSKQRPTFVRIIAPGIALSDQMMKDRMENE